MPIPIPLDELERRVIARTQTTPEQEQEQERARIAAILQEFEGELEEEVAVEDAAPAIYMTPTQINFEGMHDTLVNDGWVRDDRPKFAEEAPYGTVRIRLADGTVVDAPRAISKEEEARLDWEEEGSPRINAWNEVLGEEDS